MAHDAHQWLQQIKRIVARNETHGFHLANWKVRKHLWAPVLHFVLNNTERRARSLTDGQLKCVAAARRWLSAVHPLPVDTLA